MTARPSTDSDNLPNSTRPRSFYGIPASMVVCPCGDPDCLTFSLGYPYCQGCGEHHRMPVASEGESCPVDTAAEREPTP